MMVASMGWGLDDRLECHRLEFSISPFPSGQLIAVTPGKPHGGLQGMRNPGYVCAYRAGADFSILSIRCNDRPIETKIRLGETD